MKFEKPQFIWEIQDEDEILDLLKSKPKAVLILHLLAHKLVSKFNFLIKDDKPYTIKDLAQEIKVSEKTATKYFKLFVDKGLIAEAYFMLDDKPERVWVVNPNYFLANPDKTISRSIYKLFENKGN